MNRFGVGSPIALRREPSVPPRIGVRTGSMPSGPDRALGQLGGLRELLHEAAHVRVLRRDDQLHPRSRHAPHDLLGRAPEQGGVRGELAVVEVAHDRPHHRAAAGSHDLVRMDEALAV